MPMELGPTRPVRAVDMRITRQDGGRPNRSEKAADSAPSVVARDALDAGAAPVDSQRVEEIRRAIEKGEYPLVPAKIADAIIAAGILLRYRND